MASEGVSRGIYNIEYFSGSQVAIYIGDIWVDEITQINYSVSQRKTPLYGYADSLFKAVTKGQVLVQGSFTINFKEAGYLWLVLHEYNKKRGHPSLMNPFSSSEDVNRKNIEQFVDGEVGTSDRNQLLSNLAARASLTGFSSTQRYVGTSGQSFDFEGPPDQRRFGLGAAENVFEQFEDMIWKSNQAELDEKDRRADDPRLNDFDIYVAFGDFAGDNRHNHTIQKLAGVHIIGSGKQIVADGQPIQEEYQFIARNLV